MQQKKGFPPPAVAETTLVFGQKRGAWDLRVWSQPFACIQLGDFAQLVFVEEEIEHIEIFRMHVGVTDLGITTRPESKCQRITICAGVCRISARADVSAAVRIPLLLLVPARTPGLGLNLVRDIPGV